MANKLQDKVAIVTGASKGIGAACALELAREGAHVVVNYASSKDAADKVVNEILQMGGKAIAVKADISKIEDIAFLFAQTLKAFNKVDILVNNAGVYDAGALADVTVEQYNNMFSINVFGLLFTSQEAAKHFGPNGGNIINISSIASIVNMPPYLVYNATKAAVDAITKTLGKELAPRNIRVNGISPGMIETEGLHEKGIMTGEFRKEMEPHIPLGRIGQPADLTKALILLASDDSAWMTGASIVICGGLC